MNEAMFTQGLGVKEKAFIRVASTASTPAPLVIANNYLYEGVPATPEEEELIHIATTLLSSRESALRKQLVISSRLHIIAILCTQFLHPSMMPGTVRIQTALSTYVVVRMSTVM